MTDKVQKIRAEIERLLNEPVPSHDPQCKWEDGYWCALYKIEEFIDSLQEEPMSEDLGKCTSKIILEGTNFNKSWYAHPELAFKAGAQWKFERIKEALLSEVLPCFMHGGEADEVVAKLEKVLNQKK